MGEQAAMMGCFIIKLFILIYMKLGTCRTQLLGESISSTVRDWEK